MRAKVLLDMDVVLVNWLQGVCNTLGLNITTLRQDWQKGEWDAIPPIARAMGWARSNSHKTFWKALHEEMLEEFGNSIDWWAALEPQPWFQSLIDFVDNLVGPEYWYIATTAHLTPGCYAGKAAWLINYLPDTDRFIFTRHKWLCANPNTVLVDDRPKSVDLFKKHGGHAVLFPWYGNKLHSMEDNSLPYVIARLEEIVEYINYHQ